MVDLRLAILLVEDEELIAEVLTAPLEEGGYSVLHVCDGRGAVTALESGNEKYRGLITDINLGHGGPNGWEIARHARELNPDLPVLYMSGASAHEWSSLGVPNSLMIAKPFAPAQIVTAISSLLNHPTANLM
ncbi:MAG: response regulator [Beijerinckiaceae bacterium]